MCFKKVSELKLIMQQFCSSRPPLTKGSDLDPLPNLFNISFDKRE